MGTGGGGMKAQSLQDQLKQQQMKQVKSAKYPPFSENEVFTLQKKFKILDKNSRQSIKIEEFKELLEIRMHFFRERIYTLIEEDMKKRKTETMDFATFMQYLTVFHPLADVESKKDYMFKIYDLDQDGKITKEDLTEVFKILFMKSQTSAIQKKSMRPQIFQTNFMNKDYVEKLGKDIMNIVDDDKSNSIELDEFVKMFTDTDLKFRMNIVF
ncbi:unnamed protein product [Paramecium octaurelia]|uniref:EF-hand domain-containing protein n=1 Tax=Paramecium octaurelia TaxID=43137 RepID=A0A8S1VNX1_PAROT|nr:unnamed protein product [Paramecium octaurelia]